MKERLVGDGVEYIFFGNMQAILIPTGIWFRESENEIQAVQINLIAW